jgi:hypothetical protein
MLKQLNVKKNLVALSQYSLGEQPKEEDIQVMREVGLDMMSPFKEEDEHLLVTLHSLVTLQATSNTPMPYSRTGTWWKSGLGFQHTDPVSDIRGGGLLSLKNLIYFIANHPRASTEMIKKRANRQLTQDNTYTSFPWACAGINLTRLLAMEYEIIRESGMTNTGTNAKYSNKTSWRYISSANGFNRMYVCLFLLLDRLWDEMGATYMDFNRVLQAVSEEFSMQLALSTSLTNLENRVHKRVQFVDPDVSYNSLPEATVATEPMYDMESQSSYFSTTRSDSCSSNFENPLISFITAQIPSYDSVVETLVPTPPQDNIPDLLCGDYERDQPISMRRRTPYSMQIV